MPDLDPADALNRIVATHWQTAARHAWAQYQERGRGAIVFSLHADRAGEKEPLRYLTFQSENTSQIAEGPFALLQKLVHRYDPEAEVVIAVVLPDGRTVFDVFEHTPSPKTA